MSTRIANAITERKHLYRPQRSQDSEMRKKEDNVKVTAASDPASVAIKRGRIEHVSPLVTARIPSRPRKVPAKLASHSMIRRSQGEPQFDCFQWEMKLPKGERQMCHEARFWIYGRTGRWHQALNIMIKCRRRQKFGARFACSTTKGLESFEKCSRIVSLQEFSKYDKPLRQVVQERDARKTEEGRRKREERERRNEIVK